jgi:hypothetical protein
VAGLADKGWWMNRLTAFLLRFLFLAGLGTTSACAQPTLDDLWQGKAHFRQVGELNYGGLHADGVPKASAGWYAVADGRWYAFSRTVIPRREARCASDHTQVVVSESRDQGRSWSAPVVAAAPASSRAGDGCAILDGSTFYDRSDGTWHMLAQCLDYNARGGWSLCHYSRRAASPVGRFSPNPANPVVRGGRLWSRICAGSGKRCHARVRDEGTPDIVEKVNGQFLVTLHGFDGRNGYRTVVSTPDFRTWSTSDGPLPGDAILSSADCAAWLPGCVGFGQGEAVRSGRHIYMIAEAMNRSLMCQANQNWTFALLRSREGSWPRSGRGGWETFRNTPLLRPARPDPRIACQISYARWLVDGADIYLVYEEWAPGRRRLHRRLLKLVSGPGPAVSLR